MAWFPLTLVPVVGHQYLSWLWLDLVWGFFWSNVLPKVSAVSQCLCGVQHLKCIFKFHQLHDIGHTAFISPNAQKVLFMLPQVSVTSTKPNTQQVFFFYIPPVWVSVIKDQHWPWQRFHLAWRTFSSIAYCQWTFSSIAYCQRSLITACVGPEIQRLCFTSSLHVFLGLPLSQRLAKTTTQIH